MPTHDDDDEEDHDGASLPVFVKRGREEEEEEEDILCGSVVCPEFKASQRRRVFLKSCARAESRSLRCYDERNRHGPALEDPSSPQLRLLQRLFVVKVSH